MKQLLLCITFLFAYPYISFSQNKKSSKNKAILSIDTKHTISKIKTAKTKKGTIIIGSSYEGVLVGVDYNGNILWENNAGKGIMNHDIWCGDITKDGIDEILVASASGTIFCLNSEGKTLWEFQQNEFPMISVCSVKDKSGASYIACGGGDMNFYFLSAKGKLLKTIASSTYSDMKPNSRFDDGHMLRNVHTINFLRPIPQPNGSDILVLNGVISHGARPSTLYFFKPLETKPFKKVKIPFGNGPVGEMRVRDTDGDGNYELLIGSSNGGTSLAMGVVNLNTGKVKSFAVGKHMKVGFGYRVTQPEVIKIKNKTTYFVLTGNQIGLIDESLDPLKLEKLKGKYSFNSMWKDPMDNKLILGSAQSGGSCIHIINLKKPKWKQEYVKLIPPGKIKQILANTKETREALKKYTSPSWERPPLKTYLISPSNDPKEVIADIKKKYNTPEFLEYVYTKKVENWDRSVLNNAHFEKGRDQRKNYVLSQQEVLDVFVPKYRGNPGITFWGGHGRDVYFFNPETTKKVIDASNNKKTIIIYPEMDADVPEFKHAMDHLFYPLAEYSKGKNTNLYIRSKHAFWFSTPYTPHWSRFLSGEFSDIFIASMEETEDMSMDQTIAGRLGIWASGVVDDIGSRCARDNANFMRSRTYSHQMLPNHFLRYTIYNMAYGARYPMNFKVDPEYFSILWELIAKGALYVPKRSEILSFSPVHLSMTNPDEKFLREGNDGSWTVRDDVELTGKDSYVFSRLSGAWSGAQVSDWDFSSFASGVKDRRLNFIPPYKNGMVLITPPQNGTFADKNAPRGKLTDHLNPIYKNMMKEYITNGKHYLSSDGTQTYKANEYYKTIKTDIEESKKKLPLTVSGTSVGWVTAQTSPKHIRLTLVDGGYINPDDRKAIVEFHSVTPVKMTDILNGEKFNVNEAASIEVEIKCGMFRFIDIELKEPLN